MLIFYERISVRLLPNLRDRPETLERFPEGVTGTAAPHFWQKHTPSYYPAWIPPSVAPCMPPLKPTSEFSTLSARQSASAVAHLPQGYLIPEFASANANRTVRGVQPTPCAVGHLGISHRKGRHRLIDCAHRAHQRGCLWQAKTVTTHHIPGEDSSWTISALKRTSKMNSSGSPASTRRRSGWQSRMASSP